MPEPVVIAWSGGKDSALALHAVRRDGRFTPAALLTTCHRETDANAMHGIPRAILHAQARALGLPLTEVWVTEGAGNAEYEERWREALRPWQARQVAKVVYGDLFLADIRAYRDRFLATLGLEAWYPLWGRPTPALARDFIEGGFQAKLVCVDPRQLDPRFLGRDFDPALLAELPAGTDPCGENGEFHTLVHASPDFHTGPLRVCETARHQRNGFAYATYSLAASPET